MYGTKVKVVKMSCVDLREGDREIRKVKEGALGGQAELKLIRIRKKNQLIYS